MRKVLAVALAAVLLLTVSGTALAAKGGKGGAAGGGSTSVTIAVPDGVFAGTTTASVSGASGLWVFANCSQAGVVVYQQYELTDSAGNAVLTLGPTPMWSGGGATCVGQAGSFSSTAAWKSVASATFTVSG